MCKLTYNGQLHRLRKSQAMGALHQLWWRVTHWEVAMVRVPCTPRILSWTRENPRVHWSYPICGFCCHGHNSKCSVSLVHNCPRLHKALHVPICKCGAPRTTFQVDTPFVKSSVDDLNVWRIPLEPCARKCCIAHASGSNTFRFANPDALEAVMSRVSPLLDHMVQGDEYRPLLSAPSLVDCRD